MNLDAANSFNDDMSRRLHRRWIQCYFDAEVLREPSTSLMGSSGNMGVAY